MYLFIVLILLFLLRAKNIWNLISALHKNHRKKIENAMKQNLVTILFTIFVLSLVLYLILVPVKELPIFAWILIIGILIILSIVVIFLSWAAFEKNYKYARPFARILDFVFNVLSVFLLWIIVITYITQNF